MTRPAHASSPWQFRKGDTVYVRFHDPDITYRVVDGFLHNGMPHYRLFGHQEIWVVPQIHLSTNCIRDRQ